MRKLTRELRRSLVSLALLCLAANGCDDANGPTVSGGALSGSGCTNYRLYLHTTGVLSPGERVTSVFATPRQIICGLGTDGVALVSWSDSYRPEVVGTLSLPGEVTDIGLVSGVVVATLGNRGLAAIDVTNPSTPQLLTVVSSVGEMTALAASGRVVWVVDDGVGIRGFSWVDGDFVALGSDNTPGSPVDIARWRDRLYVADANHGLRTLSVSDPWQPFELSRVQMPMSPTAVSVWGPTAYVAMGVGGVQVVDVSSVGNESLAATLATDGSSLALTASADRLVVADRTRGVTIYDRRSRLHPARLSRMDTADEAVAVVVSRGHVVVADDDAGVRLIDARNAQPIPVTASAELGGNTVDVSGYNGRWFAADASGGVSLMTITDNGITTLQTVNVPGSERSLHRFDNGVLVRTSGGVYPVTLSGDTLRVEDGVPQSTPALGVAADGDIVYAALGSAGFLTHDVSSQDDPYLLTSPGTIFSAVALSATHAFVASRSSRITIYSRFDPRRPVALNAITNGGAANDAVVHDGYLLVGLRSGNSGLGVEIFDIANPLIPVLAGRIRTAGRVVRLAVDGEMLFIAGDTGGLEIFDLTNPLLPVAVGARPSESVQGVAVVGDGVVVAEPAGVLLLRPPCR